MDNWLLRRLTLSGVTDGDGYARKVVTGYCPRCQRTVLRGLDARTCGLPVTVEPTPLDETGEVVVLAHGARTYDLEPLQRGGFSLEPRRAEHIRRARLFDVVGTHYCAWTWPAIPVTRASRSPLPEDPPF